MAFSWPTTFSEKKSVWDPSLKAWQIVSRKGRGKGLNQWMESQLLQSMTAMQNSISQLAQSLQTSLPWRELSDSYWGSPSSQLSAAPCPFACHSGRVRPSPPTYTSPGGQGFMHPLCPRQLKPNISERNLSDKKARLLDRLRGISEKPPAHMAGDLHKAPVGLSLRHLSRKLTRSIHPNAVGDLRQRRADLDNTPRYQQAKNLPGDNPAQP